MAMMTPGGLVCNLGTPTIALTAAAGTGATASIVGSNYAGRITLTAGALALATGKILTLSLVDGVVAPNGLFCYFEAGNQNFATVRAGLTTQLWTVKTTNTVELWLGGAALSAGLIYIGDYLIAGY